VRIRPASPTAQEHRPQLPPDHDLVDRAVLAEAGRIPTQAAAVGLSRQRNLDVIKAEPIAAGSRRVVNCSLGTGAPRHRAIADTTPASFSPSTASGDRFGSVAPPPA